MFVVLFFACVFFFIESKCACTSSSTSLTYDLTDTNFKEQVNFWISDPDASTHECGNITTWDVSRVTNFNEIFKSKKAFNADVRFFFTTRKQNETH